MALIAPSTPFLKLSEALTWIAFGDVSNSDIHWTNYSKAKQQLADALEAFATAASREEISVLGKLVENHLVDPDACNTDTIPANRFHDFRQYDQSHCGLRFGRGLFGFPDAQGYCIINENMHGGRQQFYRDVLVERTSLLSAFPVAAVGVKTTYDDAVQWCREWIAGGRGNDQNKAWQKFKSDPQFDNCSRDNWFRPAWETAKTTI